MYLNEICLLSDTLKFQELFSLITKENERYCLRKFLIRSLTAEKC